jgi:membrane-associated progesterone receptor component
MPTVVDREFGGTAAAVDTAQAPTEGIAPAAARVRPARRPPSSECGRSCRALIGMTALGVLVLALLWPFSGHVGCPLPAPVISWFGRTFPSVMNAMHNVMPTSFPSAAQAVSGGVEPPVFRGIDAATGLPLWEESDLATFTKSPILMAVMGDVFDVTSGAEFYGPGASYALFAGRDSTRALSLGSLETTDWARRGDVSDFSPEQHVELLDRHAFYMGKYPRIGKLMSSTAPTSADTHGETFSTSSTDAL